MCSFVEETKKVKLGEIGIFFFFFFFFGNSVNKHVDGPMQIYQISRIITARDYNICPRQQGNQATRH